MAERLELRSRAVFDFLDGLVALGPARARGLGETARVRATPRDTAVFLDTTSPQYIGGFLEMANARLYGFWDGLTEALQTGQPAERDQAHRAGRCSRSSTPTPRASSSS